MSEFSSCFFVKGALTTITRALTARGLRAFVVPGQRWTLVLNEEEAAPFERAVRYQYAADHGFSLTLLRRGAEEAVLSASSETRRRSRFEPAPWIARKMLTKSKAAALDEFLRGDSWSHRDVRDRACALLELPRLSWVSWHYITAAGVDVERSHPGGVWVGSSPESLRSTAPRATASEVQQPNADEFSSLSAAFLHAAPLTPRPTLDRTVDLASTTSARAWLDAKKRVDPAAATESVWRELEHVVRRGRFETEGEISIVVREAAAMLLGRCVKHTLAEPATWIQERSLTATSADERAAWRLVATTAGVEAGVDE